MYIQSVRSIHRRVPARVMFITFQSAHSRHYVSRARRVERKRFATNQRPYPDCIQVHDIIRSTWGRVTPLRSGSVYRVTQPNAVQQLRRGRDCFLLTCRQQTRGVIGPCPRLDGRVVVIGGRPLLDSFRVHNHPAYIAAPDPLKWLDQVFGDNDFREGQITPLCLQRIAVHDNEAGKAQVAFFKQNRDSGVSENIHPPKIAPHDLCVVEGHQMNAVGIVLAEPGKCGMKLPGYTRLRLIPRKFQPRVDRSSETASPFMIPSANCAAGEIHASQLSPVAQNQIQGGSFSYFTSYRQTDAIPSSLNRFFFSDHYLGLPIVKIKRELRQTDDDGYEADKCCDVAQRVNNGTLLKSHNERGERSVDACKETATSLHRGFPREPVAISSIDAVRHLNRSPIPDHPKSIMRGMT